MASEQEVKRYLAYWFQLGKKVVIRNGESAVLPQPLMAGDRYSQEFEKIWQQILSPNSGNCYLEGTEETIAELLTPKWQIESCARCDMPIPQRTVGMPAVVCPCCDLSTWPNTELPAPRNGVCSQGHLSEICDRLHKANNQQLPCEDLSSKEDTNLPTAQDPASSQGRMTEICKRLHRANNQQLPCEDLSSKEDTDLPAAQDPTSSQDCLSDIRECLHKANGREHSPSLESSFSNPINKVKATENQRFGMPWDASAGKARKADSNQPSTFKPSA